MELINIICTSFQPFYGGKKHRVCAEVFCPGEKKPFLTVDGEWNGVMTAKWAEDGVSRPACLPLVTQSYAYE